MATRFCEHCGQPIVGDTKFCTNCGAPVPPPVDPQPQQPQQPQQPYYEPQPNPQPTYQTEQQNNFQNDYQPQQPVGDKPNNMLALSIVTTILCCWPLGIPAILNATKVDKFWNNGQYDEARNASKKAKTFIIISAAVGFVVSILYAIFLIAAEDL